jgi:hypothetical protein
MERSFITDINYFGSNIRSEDDLIKMYNDGVLHHSSFSEKYPISVEISSISESIESRLKTRMSQLSLGVYNALQNGGAKNIREDDEMYFITAFAEIETTDKIIEDIVINKSQLVSPTLFHNSVHNTPLGYYTIINKIHNYCTTISDGIDTGSSFSDFMNFKNQMRDKMIVCAGDEYSDFLKLDRGLELKLFPFFTSYRVTASDKGYCFVSNFSEKKDLIEVLEKYDNILLSGSIFNEIKSVLPQKNVITDYPVSGDNPIGCVARLAMPFTLKLAGETAVVEFSRGKYSLFNVRL